MGDGENKIQRKIVDANGKMDEIGFRVIQSGKWEIPVKTNMTGLNPAGSPQRGEKKL